MPTSITPAIAGGAGGIGQLTDSFALTLQLFSAASLVIDRSIGGSMPSVVRKVRIACTGARADPNNTRGSANTGASALLDVERPSIRINPAKGSASRTIPTGSRFIRQLGSAVESSATSTRVGEPARVA
jgi:hypothetical protein